MTRTVIARPLFLLLRNTRGRFTRLRAAVATKPARRQVRRPRPMLAAAQITPF